MEFPSGVFFVTDDINLQNNAMKEGLYVLNSRELRDKLDPPATAPPPPLPAPQSPESQAAASVLWNLSACVEELLRVVLAEFLQKKRMKDYGENWQDVTKPLPPWRTLAAVVDLIDYCRSSSFMEVIKRRDDIKLFTDLKGNIGAPGSGAKTPVEEMDRLRGFLSQAVAVLEFVNGLDQTITGTYQEALQASLATLRGWEVKRDMVERNVLSVAELERDVAAFWTHHSRSEWEGAGVIVLFDSCVVFLIQISGNFQVSRTVFFQSPFFLSTLSMARS